MSAEPIKVLLVEDSQEDARILLDAVARRDSSRFVITHAERLLDALRELRQERFDAVLLDVTVPFLEWTSAIRRVHEQAPEVPIIVLTGVDDEATAVQAIKEGAQDSLVKGEVTASLLARAVRYAIERHQLKMALEAMALVDDLTGLYNRRGFLTLARQQLKVSDRMGKRLALVFVDVDGMKAINDSFGHRDGDLALRDVADLLRETFRDSDIIARIGGDEFVVLAMESGSPSDVLVTRLLDKLRLHASRAVRRFPLELSVGVALYEPDSPGSVEELMERADTLMYQQKHGKRRTPPGSLLAVSPAPPAATATPAPGE